MGNKKVKYEVREAVKSNKKQGLTAADLREAMPGMVKQAVKNVADRQYVKEIEEKQKLEELTAKQTQKTQQPKPTKPESIYIVYNTITKVETKIKTYKDMMKYRERQAALDNFDKDQGVKDFIDLLKGLCVIGSWKLQSNSIHFVTNEYVENLNNCDLDRVDELIKKYLQGVKPLISKWETYEIELRRVKCHEYRQEMVDKHVNTTGLKIKNLGFDITFRDKKITEIIVKYFIAKGIKIKGYSNLVLN